MARPRVLLGVFAAWLTVVLVGSTAVWAVISQTGKELVPMAGPPIQASVSAEPTKPSKPGKPGASLAPSGDPIQPNPPPAPPTPTSGPSESEHVSGSGSAGPDEHPSTGGEHEEQKARGSWKGRGGTVFAECSAHGIRVSAIADSGYRAEAETDEGARRGKVKFEKFGEDGEEIAVYVTCGSDGPRFYVRTD